MRCRRFYSELSCDEVWYRLNILLRSFAVWGPERYEISGELTEWGCYLRLRRPNMPAGMLYPLWLWTEEDGAGSWIACRFFPTGRELLGLLAAGGGLCLEMILAELVTGASVLRALLFGFCEGCVAVAAIYFLMFGVVGLVFGKQKRALLQWIQTYLLRRELDGVLLPDMGSQRREWVGLSKEAGPVNKKRFVFRAALPPEELPAALRLWLSQRTLQSDGREKWSARWRDSHLAIFRTEIEEGQAEAGTLKIFAGWYKTWQFANPFYGVVEPDGQGGSILRGAFRRHPRAAAFSGGMLLLVCCLLHRCLPPFAAWPLSLLGGLCWIAGIFKNPMKNSGSCKILELLQTCFEER